MGTTKSGRYLNTNGRGTYIDKYTTVHSSEGDFTKPSKKDDRLRLKGGGHGQKNLDLLEKYGLKYEIVHTYKNGVRIGYVPDHKRKNKQSGVNQSWFPAHWTDNDIRKAGQHVMRVKKSLKSNDNPKYAWYKGVRVGIYTENGRVTTIFPDSNQYRRPKDREKFRKKYNLKEK